MPAQLIKPFGEPVTVRPANGNQFTLEELQEAVHGYIEAVYLRDGRIMFVDEDGKYKTNAINERATILNLELGNGDTVVGNAVVVTRDMVD